MEAGVRSAQDPRVLTVRQLRNALAMGVGGGDWASTRPGVKGAEPQHGLKTLASQTEPQALGRGVLGRKGPLPWPYLLPRPAPSPQGRPSSPELGPDLLGCFLPLYRVLLGTGKGTASSSWRQEGACSQGHLELRGGEPCPSPESPPGPGSQPGARRGPGPFPKPSSL